MRGMRAATKEASMRKPWVVYYAVVMVALAGALAGCAKDEVSEGPRIEDRTFALEGADVPLRIGPLSGSLSNLVVTQRVNLDTGESVSAPQLRGTLALKNVSEDQTVRIVSGQVVYLDGSGGRIMLAEGRGDTEFKPYAYGGDRLDPGMEMSQSIDVPFPATALKQTPLANIRLGVSFIPMPYREEAVVVPVTVDATG
jgi:hypothetical protein